jgi:hypothetical protein
MLPGTVWLVFNRSSVFGLHRHGWQAGHLGLQPRNNPSVRAQHTRKGSAIRCYSNHGIRGTHGMPMQHTGTEATFRVFRVVRGPKPTSCIPYRPWSKTNMLLFKPRNTRNTRNAHAAHTVVRVVRGPPTPYSFTKGSISHRVCPLSRRTK